MGEQSRKTLAALEGCDVRLLSPKPGDVLVLTPGEYIAPELSIGARQFVLGVLERQGHKGVDVLIMPHGSKLEVVRKPSVILS